MVRTSLLAALVVALYLLVSMWTWVTRPAAPAHNLDRDAAETTLDARARTDARSADPEAGLAGRDAPISSTPAADAIDAIDAATQGPLDAHRDGEPRTPRTHAPRDDSGIPRGHVPPPPDDWPPDDAYQTGSASDTQDDATTTRDEASSSPAGRAPPVVRPDAAVRLRPRGEQVGDHLEYTTRLDLELEAEIDMGLFSPSVTYVMRENEVLDVRVLPPRDGRASHELVYVTSRQTRTLPIVGKKQKDHRVHGKTYLALAGVGDAPPSITRPNGKDAVEKEAKLVVRSLSAVAGDPPLAAALPPGVDVPLDLGERIALDSLSAKRLLGLPIDELEVQDVVLVLRSVEARDFATFDVTARLRGEAELGDGNVGLRGKLAGTCVIAADGARLVSLDLEGRISVEQDAESGGMIATSGSGPLAIKRRIDVIVD